MDRRALCYEAPIARSLVNDHPVWHMPTGIACPRCALHIEVNRGPFRRHTPQQRRHAATGSVPEALRLRLLSSGGTSHLSVDHVFSAVTGLPVAVACGTVEIFCSLRITTVERPTLVGWNSVGLHRRGKSTRVREAPFKSGANRRCPRLAIVLRTPAHDSRRYDVNDAFRTTVGVTPQKAAGLSRRARLLVDIRKNLRRWPTKRKSGELVSAKLPVQVLPAPDFCSCRGCECCRSWIFHVVAPYIFRCWAILASHAMVLALPLSDRRDRP